MNLTFDNPASKTPPKATTYLFKLLSEDALHQFLLHNKKVETAIDCTFTLSDFLLQYEAMLLPIYYQRLQEASLESDSYLYRIVLFRSKRQISSTMELFASCCVLDQSEPLKLDRRVKNGRYCKAILCNPKSKPNDYNFHENSSKGQEMEEELLDKSDLTIKFEY
jgi:hypothetical protein